MLFEPDDDMGAIDESSPGQRRRVEGRAARREVRAVIEALVKKVELAGAGGSMC